VPPRRRTFEETDHRRRFGDEVRALRLERGWSQEQLAERADLHRTYVVRVERGTVNVSIDAIRAIADGLGVAIARLFSGPDDGTGSRGAATRGKRYVSDSSNH
jgi:transcriptional regulator with XRE-family HTH domain